MTLSPRAATWAARVARGFFILLGISPFLPRLVGGLPVLGAVSHAFEAWFTFQCNRDPARTQHFLGELLPVCTRCLGIYLGLGLGAAILRPRLSVWPLRVWVGLGAVYMLLDVATELLDMRPAWAPLRLATGLFLAYPVGSAVVWALRDSANPDA